MVHADIGHGSVRPLREGGHDFRRYFRRPERARWPVPAINPELLSYVAVRGARAVIPTNRQTYKDLTTDHLFALISALPADVEADRDLGRREWCRWLVRAPVELHFAAQDGTRKVEYVDIRDLCMTGICLKTRNAVPAEMVGELILPLEDGDYKVGVRVVHCTQTIGGWNIGCHLLLPDAVQ